MVDDLETYLLSIVTPMTHADVLGTHLTDTLTAWRIVEISSILGQAEIARTARAMILKKLWAGEPSDAFETLLFGERVGDKEIIGASYYQILVSRSRPWAHDDRLTELHRQHLEFGRRRCAESWDEIFNDWGFRAQIPSSSRSNYIRFDQYWLLAIWKEIAQGKYAGYDVVGRLQAAKRCTDRYDKSWSGMPQKKQEEIQATMYTHFVPEVATDSAILDVMMPTTT